MKSPFPRFSQSGKSRPGENKTLFVRNPLCVSSSVLTSRIHKQLTSNGSTKQLSGTFSFCGCFGLLIRYSAYARLVNQGLPGEIRRFFGESRLAQEHGMASHEGIRIDPVWASQEEKKHSTQPGCFVNAVRNETSNDDNVKGLHRLRCLRGLPYMNQGVSVYPSREPLCSSRL